jgi:hypothetical protein
VSVPAGSRHIRTNRLPGSDELFRRTADGVTHLDEAILSRDEGHDREAARFTGRTRHDEKITVYLSVDELMDLEQARLRLKRDFGMRTDRGRIVRAALVELLDDLGTTGEESALVRRLRQA